MEVTKIYVKVVQDNGGNGNLMGFATIILDNMFAIRDIKIIRDKRNGVMKYWVAMPSRQVKERCPQCDAKNLLKSRFCCMCGKKLSSKTRPRKQHVDVAHPINQSCRSKIELAILTEYLKELGIHAAQGSSDHHVG